MELQFYPDFAMKNPWIAVFTFDFLPIMRTFFRIGRRRWRGAHSLQRRIGPSEAGAGAKILQKNFGKGIYNVPLLCYNKARSKANIRLGH